MIILFLHKHLEKQVILDIYGTDLDLQPEGFDFMVINQSFQVLLFFFFVVVSLTIVALVQQPPTFSQGHLNYTVWSAGMIQAKAPLFYSDSSIVSFDSVCLRVGPDSAVILAGVSIPNTSQCISAGLFAFTVSHVQKIQGGFWTGVRLHYHRSLD